MLLVESHNSSKPPTMEINYDTTFDSFQYNKLDFHKRSRGGTARDSGVGCCQAPLHVVKM